MNYLKKVNLKRVSLPTKYANLIVRSGPSSTGCGLAGSGALLLISGQEAQGLVLVVDGRHFFELIFFLFENKTAKNRTVCRTQNLCWTTKKNNDLFHSVNWANAFFALLFKNCFYSRNEKVGFFIEYKLKTVSLEKPWIMFCLADSHFEETHSS